MKQDKKKTKKGGLDLLWLTILPVLVVLAILLALSLWSNAESTISKKFGPDVIKPLGPDEIFDILEDE